MRRIVPWLGRWWIVVIVVVRVLRTTTTGRRIITVVVGTAGQLSGWMWGDNKRMRYSQGKRGRAGDPNRESLDWGCVFRQI